MEFAWKYITEADETATIDIARDYMPRFAPLPPTHLYHYTTGETLIRIIESGKLWSTQIGCLNDTAEVRYAVEELHKRVRAKLENAHQPETEPLFRRLDEVLATPQLETAGLFIACFSEQKDDLSQWRAYSGGEGGYAIQFDLRRLAKSGLLAESLLFKVEYDVEKQTLFLDDIIKSAEQHFINCEGRQRAPNLDEWAREFVEFYLWRIEIFTALLKHPAFMAEKEWRFVYPFRPDDETPLCFRQRQSIMSRHLPLKLEGKLPITGIVIGPCRYSQLSRTAVADLLKKGGYDPSLCTLEISNVPYRVV